MRWIIFSLLFAGCAGTPAIQVRTVEIPVVELRHCLSTDDIPATPEPFDRGDETDARNLLALATANLREWRQYGVESQATMRRCAE
ncbi:hypothetical protein [Parasphingopyxis sp.]|uniref:hypothetical protein n=1 Tax=Parasphingopyxis sp. TaxID=1920299 RepID=UPI00261196E3|nr:hypothetical protein [Parasphingopyxis sp.]